MSAFQLVAWVSTACIALIGYLITLHVRHRPKPLPRHVHTWSKWQPYERWIVARDSVALPESEQYVLVDHQRRRCETCGVIEVKEL